MPGSRRRAASSTAPRRRPAAGPAAEGGGDPDWERIASEAKAVAERARALLDKMHLEDREEAVGLNERIHDAVSARDPEGLSRATSELKELIFFVEGA